MTSVVSSPDTLDVSSLEGVASDDDTILELFDGGESNKDGDERVQTAV